MGLGFKKIKAILLLTIHVGSLAVLAEPAFAQTSPITMTFSSDQGGYPYDVFTMRADGTRTQLTSEVGGDLSYESTFSPDGSKIVWVRHDAASGQSDLWTMNVDGTNKTQITNTGGSFREHGPDWSPDGSKILFFNYGTDVNDDIWVINADGTNQTRLTTNLATDNEPRWSPDGSKIVWMSESDGGTEIWSMNADGSNKTQLTNNADSVNDQFPVWSPDGSKILWVSDRNGDSDMFTMNADGTLPVQITFDAIAEVFPSWNPNDKITYNSGNAIWEVNSDGTGATQLTAGGAISDYWPERMPSTPALPAATPTVSSVTPDSPANDNSPRVIGSATAGSTVRIYTDAACITAHVGEGSAEDFADTGIAVTVADDSTTSFYATATSAVGDPSGCSLSTVSYVEDSTAPNTTIDSGPTGTVANNDPSFEFSSPDATASFECSRDGGAFSSCASPKDYTDLSDGDHTFEVRAVDAAGNTDATPDSRSFTIDSTPPDTSISSGPTGGINTDSATFGFSSAEGVSFECKLDTGSFESCTSTKTYNSLSDGDHTFEVRSIDAIGNIDPSPAVRTFRVDTVAPGTTIDSGVSGLTTNNDPSFGFSSDDATATFECSLDSASFTSCTSTKNYTDLSDGGHTFEVRAVDAVGHTDQTPASRSFTVDTTPPDTSISSGPTGTITTASATFGFSSAEGVSFQCRMDNDNWESCTSTKAYSALAEGDHTFRVRSTDLAGNTDPSPALRTFRVDTVAPNTVLGSTFTSGRDATIHFSSPEATATFECKLNSGSYAACTSPKVYNALADGAYEFSVRAVDSVGNADPTPATFSFVVDTAPPDTFINSGVSGMTNNNDPSFTFSSSHVNVTYECRMDSGAWVSCTSPTAYTNIADGDHTFSVRATKSEDSQTDASPATRSFTVDTTPPDTSISSGPTGTIGTNSATFGFSSADGVMFECRLDAGAFVPCVSTTTYSSLSEGSHSFQVRSTDLAGNIDPSPALRTFTVDTDAPETTIDSAPSGTIATNDASITFSSDEAATTFQCSFDGSSFLLTPCSSPSDYTDLAEGDHTFVVRAVDGAGNLDATPASVSFTVDTVAPDTTIDSGPSSLTNDNDPRFEFSGDADTVSYECSIDGEIFGNCNSPKDYTDLADGDHTFEVRATDEVGNTDASPAQASFTVDTTAPVSSPTVDAGPSGPIDHNDVTFEFSTGETDTTFECSLNGAAFTPCTSPQDYTDLPDGDYTFEVRVVDPAGNPGPTTTVTFTVDTTPPDAPTIDKGPEGLTNDDNPSYEFSTDDPDATFECSLDGAEFTDCTSPQDYSDLDEGDHIFEVRATDQIGNTGETTHVDFTVDTIAPSSPVIEAAPSGIIDHNDVTFEFSSPDPTDTFECSLNGAPWSACTSPQDYSDLPDGSHTVGVRVVDAAGNPGVSTVIAFEVDTTAPETTIDSGPGSLINVTTAVFELDANEPATFECRLDGGDFAACPASATISDLTDGSHTFEARAIDVVNNVDQSPESYTFTVDTQLPTPPVIESGPSGWITFNDVTFGFSSTESDVTFECALDGGFADCTSEWDYTDVSDDTHTFEVRAVDEAGNISAPVSRTFMVDTQAPEAPVFSSTPADIINVKSASFVFSSEDATSYRCSFDSGAFVECSSGESYSNLTDGSHTFEVYAVDIAGNEGSSSSASFTVDTIAPGVVSIGSGPSGTIITDSTSVTFASGDPEDTFECSLDDGEFEECTSPQGYSGLSEGDHTITVRAVDTAGNPGPSSFVTFTVDTIAPGSVTFNGGPSGFVNESTVTLDLQSSVSDDSFLCSLDGSEFVACTSTEVLSGLAEGGHTLDVRTTDTSGRVGDVASTSFTVDTIAPGAVTITGVPIRPSSNDDVTLGFSTGDPSDSFLCSLNGADYVPCSSSQQFNNLDDGAHTVNVAAFDQAGNVGPTSAAAFVVDTPSPAGPVEPKPEPSGSGTLPVEPAPVPTTEPEPTPDPDPEPTSKPDFPDREPDGPKQDGGTQDGDGGSNDDGNAGSDDALTDGSGEEAIDTGIAIDPGAVTSGFVSAPERMSLADLERDGKKRADRAGKKNADEDDAVTDESARGKAYAKRRANDAEKIAQPEWQLLAQKTAETLGFPLLLTVLVIVYLMTQYWIDRRDPKLAVAPVNAKYDVVRFE